MEKRAPVNLNSETQTQPSVSNSDWAALTTAFDKVLGQIKARWKAGPALTKTAERELRKAMGLSKDHEIPEKIWTFEPRIRPFPPRSTEEVSIMAEFAVPVLQPDGSFLFDRAHSVTMMCIGLVCHDTIRITKATECNEFRLHSLCNSVRRSMRTIVREKKESIEAADNKPVSKDIEEVKGEVAE